MKGVIVPKKSKLDWDCQQLGMGQAAMIKRYREQMLDVDRIVDSHHRQLAGLAELQAAFPQTEVVSRDAFAKLPAYLFDFVIAFGGDNHFMYLSQFVDSAIMMGVNSDDQTSTGALLEFTPADAPRIADQLSRGYVASIQWTRLSVELDGRRLSRRVLGEIYLGHQNPLLMSRYRLTYNRQTEEQKSSGVLVATGSGSTGWLSNVVKHWDDQSLPRTIPFDRSLPQAVFVIRELGQGILETGTLGFDQSLTIQSMMEDGVISLNSEAYDPRFHKPFPSGSTAVIWPNAGLWVLTRQSLGD